MALLITGCATQMDGDSANWETWESLDAGGFTVQAPAGWEYTPEQGIDSILGKFSNGEMTLLFIYGVNTGEFSGNSVYFEDPSAYTVIEESIDGFQAKIYIPAEVGGEKPTVLSIANINHFGPCTEDICVMGQENFEMIGEGLNEEEIDLAIQIFRTVDFK